MQPRWRKPGEAAAAAGYGRAGGALRTAGAETACLVLEPITARLNSEGVKPIGRANSWRHSYVAKLLQD